MQHDVHLSPSIVKIMEIRRGQHIFSVFLIFGVINAQYQHPSPQHNPHYQSHVRVDPLPPLHLEPDTVTISGFSSGGAMAMLFHFVYSALIKGCGIFSGSPYLCAEFYPQVEVCQQNPAVIDPNKLIERVIQLAAQNKIDSVGHIANSPVFIFHGRNDTVIPIADGHKIFEMYKHFKANIETNFNLEAEHGMPTTNFGAPCGVFAFDTDFIADCNYHGAFHALKHIYGDKFADHAPVTHTPGHLLTISQKMFVDDGQAMRHGLNDTGYIYVPAACLSGLRCKLHVVFHGCTEYSGRIGEIYVRKSGYLELGDANRLVLLFPQTIATNGSNPDGCWDVWGLSGPNYVTNSGHQTSTIFKMIQYLLASSSDVKTY